MNIKQTYDDYGLHIQQLDFTCGPVSLWNVLALKGIPGYSERELAALCKSEPGFGTSNEMMVQAAAKLGLDVAEAKAPGEIAELEQHIDESHFVIVCYLCLSGGGHYSIISQYDTHAVYLRDCTHGLLRINKPTFYDRWRNGDEPVERWFMAIR